jgi:hypothetical protein
MPTIVSTWGAFDANAYIDITFASDYIDKYILGDSSAWTSASTVNQSRAILRATRDLDNAFPYRGRKLNPDQALEWPRVFEIHDWPFSSLSVNQPSMSDLEREAQNRVMNAVAEQVFYLLKNVGTELTHLERQAQGIQSFSESIGPLSESVSYFGNGGGSFSRLTPDSYAYMKHYRALPRIVRGSAYDGGYR